MSNDNDAYVNEEVRALRDEFDAMVDDMQCASFEELNTVQLDDGTIIWL